MKKNSLSELQGFSLSGIHTALTLPELDLCFDVAQGLPYTLRQKHFFITHGHLDHAAGIPYIISQKKMHREPAPHFYMPSSLVEPMHSIVKLWAQIEKHDYDPQFHPINENMRIPLNPQFEIQPFQTTHRIESFGYCLIEKKKKLKKEFIGISQSELQKIAQTQVDLNEVVETPLLSFTGDTTVDFLNNQSWAQNSKTLYIECTYLDDRKSIQHARDWGHIHLDELLPLLKDIKSEKIVLIHVSSRYSDKEALRILKEKLPEIEKSRVELFRGRNL